MIKKIKLVMYVNVPDINGVIYRKEIMEKMVERLNQSKYIPIIVNINPDEYNNPPVGRVIPKTAIFDGINIYVDVDVEEHIIHLINSNEYVFGTYMMASLNKDNEVTLCKKFNIIELQIIKSQEGDNNDIKTK